MSRPFFTDCLLRRLRFYIEVEKKTFLWCARYFGTTDTTVADTCDRHGIKYWKRRRKDAA